MQNVISKDRLRHQLSFYGIPFALGNVISRSHHLVLNFASQTSQISLSQASSVRTNPDNVLVLVAVSAFPICGLRHPMKLVPFATRVRMDVMAFPSRPSVPLLITHSIVHQFLSLWTPCLVMFTSVCSKCGITNIPVDYGRMKHVLMPTSVHLAFSSRPGVPLLITNSKTEFDRVYDSNEIRLIEQVAVHPSILFLIAMDYVIRKFLFSRSRWYSQIAFPTVLMFFLVTQGKEELHYFS
ncbi:hypothetical protein T12_16418 [Trichinella patagoniensis]|uniref:Uncharacterized protein n=1 Tax=Trichinella patagoniensis TaxID=990121 RepID=A0A0V0ZU27_9BILA|nr:hypothetical protein T12_16418 [Trichinella patagoniensis]